VILHPPARPDHGKLDPARLCIDKEGTCVRRLALRLAVIVSTVAAAVGALTWGSSALAAPARPDLVVDVTVSAAEVPVVGGIVQLAIVVRNVGSGVAGDVR
jgi:hypothetical protein